MAESLISQEAASLTGSSDPDHANSCNAQASDERPNALQTIVIIAKSLAMATLYIFLCVAAGTAEFSIGFLFVLYWAAFERSDLRKAPEVTLGAAVGIALGLLLQFLQAQTGASAGGLWFVVCLLPPIYFYIRGTAPLLLNTATMLFLTVTTFGHIQAHASFWQMYVSLALAAVLFCGVPAILGAVWDRARKVADIKTVQP